jgi:predicted SnoaL-like aldol condensation-catalyzing enzyme
MTPIKTLVCGVLAAGFCATALAQVPPVGVADQQALLQSKDPKLAANKRLVFDMWRSIIQAAHVEDAEKMFTEDYIQHNPNVITGRKAMVEFMRSSRPRKEIEPTIHFPVISIIAEGDLVAITTVSYLPDPEAPGKTYASSHFDLFRIENGKIAEHWDSVPKDKNMVKRDPNQGAKPKQ